jgi:CheY-like chemotaxis protein
MATAPQRDIADCLALVVDSNATSRSILVGIARLRRGQGGAMQPGATRNRLEHTVFDFVLCEQFFDDTNESGQTLLDDLRRAHLLPFSTVFFMVTAEASYASVAEAAESALDGYLLKPFTPVALFDRLSLARLRKVHLMPIFDAIETRTLNWPPACAQASRPSSPTGCTRRASAPSCCCAWAATTRPTLFEAVIAARALPWAARRGPSPGRIRPGHARHHHLDGPDRRGRATPTPTTCWAAPRSRWQFGRGPGDLPHRQHADARPGRAAAEVRHDGVLHGRPRHRHQGPGARHLLGIDSKLFDFSPSCCWPLPISPTTTARAWSAAWPTSPAS